MIHRRVLQKCDTKCCTPRLTNNTLQFLRYPFSNFSPLSFQLRLFFFKSIVREISRLAPLSCIHAIPCVKELKTLREEVRKRVSKKLESVFGINVGYNTLCHISKVLAGESFDISYIEEQLTAGDLVYFKYAPVVSVNAERSFSRYKKCAFRQQAFPNFR